KQRLMPRQRRSGPACQQAETIVQARGDLLQTQRCDASRRKLDRQRNAVELPGNRRDQLKIFSVWREVTIQGPCPVDQQLHGAASENVLTLLSTLAGDVERRNAIDILAVNTKHLAARRENGRVCTEPHDRLGQLRRRLDEMLAIIQNQQEFSCPDR